MGAFPWDSLLREILPRSSLSREFTKAKASGESILQQFYSSGEGTRSPSCHELIF